MFRINSKDKEDKTSKKVLSDPALKHKVVTKYGTYCRTSSFRENAIIGDVYLEAYQQSGSRDLWSVQKVTVKADGNIKGELKHKDIAFPEAVYRLALFEQYHPETGELVGKTKEELGDKHFELFSEQEGFVRDNRGVPILRAHPDAIPPGRFTIDALERSKQVLESTKDLAEVNQKTDFVLSEMFNNVSAKGNFEEVMEGLIRIGLIDEFVDSISKLESHLSDLINNPDRERRERLKKKDARKFIKEKYNTGYKWCDGDIDYRYTPIDYIWDNIEDAYSVLKKLEKEKSDIRDGLNFLYKTIACVYLLEAQSLFHKTCLNSEGSEDNNTINRIKENERKAAQILKKNMEYESEDMVEKFKQFIIQGEKPVVPDFLKKFASDYKKFRQKLSNKKRQGTFNPENMPGRTISSIFIV